jgi:hypothetical protein
LGSGSQREVARLGIGVYRRGGVVLGNCSSIRIYSVSGVLIPHGASAAGLYPQIQGPRPNRNIVR